MKREIDKNNVGGYEEARSGAAMMVIRFDQINQVELELDELLEALDASPNTQLCQKMKLKISQAKTMIDAFPKLMANVQTEVEQRGRSYNGNMAKDSCIKFRFLETLRTQLWAMEGAIHEIESKVQEVEPQFSGHLTLEQSIMPSINSISYIAASQLGGAMEQNGWDEKTVTAIIEQSAKTFAEAMYSEEESSFAVKQLNGMRGHYLKVLQENERLRASSQQEAPQEPTTAALITTVNHLTTDNLAMRKELDELKAARAANSLFKGTANSEQETPLASLRAERSSPGV